MRITRRRHFFYAFVLLIFGMCFLNACGSGGPSDAPAPGSPPTPIPPGIPVVLMVSNPQLNSDGASTVTLTALVRDSSNVAQSGKTVSFSATSGALTVISGITDANGQATATLGTGFDPTNRTITVTATSGTVSATNTVDVVNTAIDISGLSSISFSDTTALTMTLKNSAGTGISGKTITVTSQKGNTLTAATYTTNGSGQIAVNVTGNAAGGGTDTITASAIGATKTFSLTVNPSILTVTTPSTAQEISINTAQAVTARYTVGGVAVVGATVVFAATRGTLSSNTATTNASGDATVTVNSSQTGPAVLSAFVASGPSSQVSVEFVATTANSITLQVNPAVIGTNTAGATTEKSLLTAVVRDVNDNLVKNKIVNFSLVNDASSGTLSPGTPITTDSSGTASTYYIGGPAPGSVTVKATETSSGVSSTIPLTVAKRALFIALATGNKIATYDATRYQKDYVALVTDSVGNPVVGATVTAKITPVSFKKGYYVWGAGAWVQVNTLVAAYSTMPSVPACANEDTLTHNALYDYNGVLDPGEDVNGNGRLDPQNVASVTATTTDATGHSLLSIVYAKDYANWVDVKLEAWASLGGSTTNAAVTFTLPILADDLKDSTVAPPGQPSPFGTSQTCYVDLTLVPVTAARIDVSWTSYSQAASYNVYRNSALLTNTTAHSYSDLGLAINTSYCYQIYWVDGFGVQRKLTDSLCSMTLSTPMAPTGLTTTTVSSTQINLSWSASTNATGYNVYRNGVLIASMMTTGITDSGLMASTMYSYTVQAYDALGNLSPQSTAATATTNASPRAPTGLVASAISSSQIDLTWTASPGAVGYNIYRSGGSSNTLISPNTYISDVSLTANTTYCYQVKAFDAAGTLSPFSVMVCKMTP